MSFVYSNYPEELTLQIILICDAHKGNVVIFFPLSEPKVKRKSFLLAKEH